MTNHESNEPSTDYYFTNPYQLEYLQRGAEQHGDDVEVAVVPTGTAEEINAAAREWADHEENTFRDDEDAFDYIRRTDRYSYEELLKKIPAMAATHFLVKEVKRNKDLGIYKLMRDYYEPAEPKPEEETDYSNMFMDMKNAFGEEGWKRLTYQIAHDNPALDKIEVVRHAWSLVPEATAYHQDLTQKELAERAILIHEGYEAHRRIAD